METGVPLMIGQHGRSVMLLVVVVLKSEVETAHVQVRSQNTMEVIV